MKNVVYFNNENEFRKYAEENKISYVENMIKNANDYQDYYVPFKDIPGCELAYVYYVEDVELYICIKWKGVPMRADFGWYNEKTFEFSLCEGTDWQGISPGQWPYKTGEKPQKIGKPTVKKLDNWRTYLLNVRKAQENARDLTFASMVAKIEEVKKNFPEANSVEWKSGYWAFEKICNGLVYTVNIEKSGKIWEKLSLADNYQQSYNMSETEKAAVMMKNGLSEKKPLSKGDRFFELMEATYKEYVKQFIGGRPF